MTESLAFFATAPKGVEPLLEAELAALGAAQVRPGRGGVHFEGPLETAYRACLWSRTANRILLPLARLPAPDADTLYQGVRALPWQDHLAPDGTLLVDFTAAEARITHTRFGAQRVKDAIVDRFLEREGRRPSVERDEPDLRINVHTLGETAAVAIDLSGDSLHRRGYREPGVAAPLKENLAAALLLKSGWAEIAAAGGALLDPMCGSGTLAIEAALIAADIAPGLERRYWGFHGWLGHRPALWRELVLEARARREAGLAAKLPAIVGCDHDPRAVRTALASAGAAGVQRLVHFERREAHQAVPPKGAATGLVIVNPPYGERLGELEQLKLDYAELGDTLKARFEGWHAAVFTGNPELGKRMGLRAYKTNAFYNGALPCRLLQFSVERSAFVDREAADRRAEAHALERALAGGGEAFANRLNKNLKTLGKWAAREGVHCYRLYDADIPEYAVAVDLYEDRVHVQEYVPPATIEPAKAEARLGQVMTVLPHALGVPPERIFLKLRQRQKGGNQYEKHDARSEFLEVREGPARLLVNLSDYLDTGLFLDHRLTRALVGSLARDRDCLNLFAYTGTATVYAALGGARSTTTVDLSATYLDWTQRNFALNGIAGRQHRLERADCLDWLGQASRGRARYGLIFVDPPTFSNSKRMTGTFDVQRDHVALLRLAATLLTPDGVLVFSNNNRRFRMDREALAGLAIEDISRKTLPRDFERNPRIHNCWKITQARATRPGS